MKKLKRIFTLVLALVLVLSLCFSLCGCDELDDMREMHAIWGEENSIDKIILGGETYLRLENLGEDVNPMYASSPYYSTVYVTKSDVPVLLSDTFGTMFDMSEDKNFISGYIYTSEYVPNKTGHIDEGSYVLYCKEELYDKYSSIDPTQVEYTDYGYEYWDIDKETEVEKCKYYYFTEEENDIINGIIENIKPTSEYVAEHNLYKTVFVSLNKITADRCLATYSYDVATDGKGNYYLEEISQDLETYTSYKVPSKYNDMFKEIEDNVFDFGEYYGYYYE